MSSIALFEDHCWSNFAPLSYTKPLFDLKIGPRSPYEQYDKDPEILIVRRYLSEVTKEVHRTSEVNPSQFDSDTLFINALINPRALDLKKLSAISHTFSILASDRLIVAKLAQQDRENLADVVQSGRKISPK